MLLTVMTTVMVMMLMMMMAKMPMTTLTVTIQHDKSEIGIKIGYLFTWPYLHCIFEDIGRYKLT